MGLDHVLDPPRPRHHGPGEHFQPLGRRLAVLVFPSAPPMTQACPHHPGSPPPPPPAHGAEHPAARELGRQSLNINKYSNY